MKKYILLSIVILCLYPFHNFGEAAAPKKIAVFPFYTQSEIDYVGTGIQDMLISRFGGSSKIESISKDIISRKTINWVQSQADAIRIGREMNIDFVVWGVITKESNTGPSSRPSTLAHILPLPVTTPLPRFTSAPMADAQWQSLIRSAMLNQGSWSKHILSRLRLCKLLATDKQDVKDHCFMIGADYE